MNGAELKRRLRILIAAIDLDGGTGTYCRLLIDGLRRYHGDQFDIDMLLLRDRAMVPADRARVDQLVVLGKEVDTDWRRLYQAVLHAGAMRGPIRRLDPDVIVTVGTYTNIIVPPVAGRRRCILTQHSTMSHRRYDTIYGPPLAELLRWRMRNQTVVCPARGVSEDLQRRFGVRDTVTIPHGIDPIPVRERARETPTDLPAEPYLVSCARLAPEKDFPTLLRAYARARDLGMSLPLFILGEGPERPRLEALLDELRIRDRVHLLGFRANPFPYMRAARCFVLPSREEGYGMVLLEAMCLGVPCIATDCPSGPPEILGDGKYGRLVPVGRADQLATAMLEVTRAPAALARMADASRRRAEDLTLERMAGAYSELLWSSYRAGRSRARRSREASASCGG